MRQWGSYFLIAFMTLWLGVIVPGHQRGQITLGPRPTSQVSLGRDSVKVPEGMSIAAGESCCRSITETAAADESSPQDSGSKKSSSTPKPRSGGMCAVCAFRMSLDVAVAFVLVLPHIGQVQLLNEQPQIEPMRVCHISPALIRGPPMGIGLLA